ncbi:MAG: saccharopine dehydrogenase NADP-binding domain-containing protein [Blastocatellia bacterium]|nr:saccharopine dehydrogenase NADP-binding domain-containing protein [Blastocatellia bacterium]
MGFKYGILGAGRQGTASGYDIARFGDADQIVFADANVEAAMAAAKRVNTLVGREVARADYINAADASSLVSFMDDLNACVSAIPYYFNTAAAAAAISAHCHFCDLGGNTGVVLQELALHEEAKHAEICLVPDCGVGPGMISNLAVYCAEQFDECEEVLIYDGGLPQKPRPPFNYALYFNIEGLTNEYWGDALYLENGKVTPTPCFADPEPEMVDIPELGRLEAFVTSGGLSTMVSTYEGKLQRLRNKTLRYPGHYALMKALNDVGFFNLNPVKVGNTEVVPRQVTHALLDPLFKPQPDDTDYMVIHMRAKGVKNGKPSHLTLDLLDRHDPATGFAAMERTTGFHAAIVAQMMVRGEIKHGAIPLEQAVNAGRMVEELAKRDMPVRVQQD